MANPTLTKGSGTFNSSGSAVLTLYHASESGSKSANLINIAVPTQDSGSTIAFDILGVTREFTLTGMCTVSDVATLSNFVLDLNGLIQGQQGNTGSSQIGYVYACQSTGTNVRVYVNDASWEYRAGEPNSISYTLTLYEVSSTNSG